MPSKNDKSPTERFTETVQDYMKYRPSYPTEILNVLRKDCNLTKESIIADIGSGTGLLSKLFLDCGNIVYGIEPNEAMRKAAENYLKQYPNFISKSGTAEATLLEDHSIDIVTAGTAFHWFDAQKAKEEFRRILKTPGWVVLIWNVRNMQESALLRDYENLLVKYGKNYRESKAQLFDKILTKDFFSPFEMQFHSFKNQQTFDWTGLKGRLSSTSYSLRPGDSGYLDMLEELKAIFNRHQQNGTVEFLYDTKVYYGLLRK